MAHNRCLVRLCEIKAECEKLKKVAGEDVCLDHKHHKHSWLIRAWSPKCALWPVALLFHPFDLSCGAVNLWLPCDYRYCMRCLKVAPQEKVILMSAIKHSNSSISEAKCLLNESPQRE